MEEKSDVWIWVGLILMALAGWAGYHFFLEEKFEPPPAAESALPGEQPPDGLSDTTSGTMQPAPAEPIMPEGDAVRKPLPEPPADVEPVAGEPVEIDSVTAQKLLVELAGRLSARPRLKTWLQSQQIVQKFVAGVDLIAHGESPAAQVTFFFPEKRFQPAARGGRLIMDSNNCARYDLPASIFASLDTKECVHAYRKLEPVFEYAYRNLGYPDGGFRSALTKASEILLATPVVEREIEISASGPYFEMTDPRLERLNNAQKHLLRMGPENVRRVQKKIREFAAALEELPAPPKR